MQVFCSSHSVGLETLLENSNVSFKHVLGGILQLSPLLLSQASPSDWHTPCGSCAGVSLLTTFKLPPQLHVSQIV